MKGYNKYLIILLYHIQKELINRLIMQEGFFTRKETESSTIVKGKPLTCIGCGLYKDCNTPKMGPEGNFKKEILNIGTMPSKTDDKVGKLFQGNLGKILQRAYKKIGIDLYEDCLNITALNCYTEDDPTNYQLDCCRSRILKVIEENKPKAIVLHGMPAVYSVLGDRWKKDIGSITKWRGWMIPDQDLNAWLFPLFDLEFVEQRRDGGEETTWGNDFRRISIPPFPKYKEPKIDIIEDLSILDTIKDKFAFDYETTGLKPHAEGHRIVCCAVADRENHAYVFMMPKTKRELEPLVNLLQNKKIGKIAQNMKFEHTWSKVRLRTQVENWLWDTMLATHVIDNRPGVTGLKFQTYVQFGVIDYSSEVEPYLKTNESSNAINKIMELVEIPHGKEKLMKYCALDAVFELRLANLQMNDICLPF